MHANFEIRSADSTAQQAIASSDWPKIWTEQYTLEGDTNGQGAVTEEEVEWRC